MKCPFCQVDHDKVIDSRTNEDGFVIRRRRMCLECGKRFTTHERVVELDIRVVKKDGAREPFRHEKIRKGLERACWKRPIPTHELEQVMMKIIQAVYSHDDSEIHTQEIGEMIMDHLIELDDVAYIRFASVYRQFADARDFVDEVRPILDRNRNRSPAPPNKSSAQGGAPKKRSPKK